MQHETDHILQQKSYRQNSLTTHAPWLDLIKFKAFIWTMQ
jgi:hypothetical protein